MSLCAAFLLAACTTDSGPEEAFEGATSNFPLLGDVPDRPVLPSSRDISHQQRHLQIERDQATEKQGEIIKSVKS